MNLLKKAARYFARKNFCRRAICKHADLSAFKEKLTRPIITGLILIAFSYVIGLPAVIALGIIAVWLHKPLVGFIGGPLIYGVSTIIFFIGLKLAGKKYFVVLTSWMTRIILEKILGDEAKSLSFPSPDESERGQSGSQQGVAQADIFVATESYYVPPAQDKKTRCPMSQIDGLVTELKTKIISTLGLMDVKPEDIKDDAQLVGGDTGIDSIDVLELVMMIEKDYGIKIESKELGAKVFASVRTLATYIGENRGKK